MRCVQKYKIFSSFQWGNYKQQSNCLQQRNNQLQPVKFRNSLKQPYNQRKWMDELLQSHNLTLFNWKEITSNMIYNKKGGFVLLRYYSGSLTKLLANIYSTDEWEKVLSVNITPTETKDSLQTLLQSLNPNHRYSQSKRPHSYWSSIENQKEFIGELFNSLDIRDGEVHKWNKISLKKIREQGGARLLFKHKTKASFFSGLFPSLYSTSLHQRMIKKQKLAELVKQHQIKRKEDWYRISFASYLYPYLVDVYPEENWKKSKFQIRSKKSKQRLLYTSLCKEFPHYLILEDYFHPLLHYVNYLQLDIFIPCVNLALEYNGEQHYDDIPNAFSYQECYRSNDEYKKIICLKQNICIYSVPYWATLLSPLSYFLKCISFCK